MDAKATELVQRYADAIEAAAVLGVKETRNLYDTTAHEAIELKLYEQARDYIVLWARLEKSIGEIEMARLCYNYASAYSLPDGDVNFWNEWSSFEKEHGNQDTSRDVLLVKSAHETCNVYLDMDSRCAVCQNFHNKTCNV